MEKFLVDLEIAMVAKLTDLMAPISVITGGLAILAGSVMLAWGIYRALMIMLGMSTEPVLTLVKDLIVKSMIIFMVTSSPWYYRSFVPDTLIGTTDALATELSDSPNIFSNVGKIMDAATNGLTAVSTSPKSRSKLRLDGTLTGWVSDSWTSFWNEVKISFGAIATYISAHLKLMVMAAGALILAIVSFTIVMLSKIFAYVSLGVGPLFIFFGCFEMTRNWFFSWLNATVGYLFAYVVVMIVWAFMTSTLSGFFLPPTGAVFTWAAVFKSFLSCLIFAKIVARIGDLASSWFGGGNSIADGTAALIAVGAGAAGKMVGGSRVRHERKKSERKAKSSEASIKEA